MGQGDFVSSSKQPWVPSASAAGIRCQLTTFASVSPRLTFRFQKLLPCPSDSRRWSCRGRRILLPGARGRRKLARLRVVQRPPRLREPNMLHLQREPPAWFGRGPRFNRHRPGQSEADPAWKAERAPKQAGWSEAKECGSILAREIIKKFMFTVPIHMTDSGQWKGRTTHKVVLQSCKFS